MHLLAAAEFHDIAPPVEYSLLPPWVIFVGVFLALSLAGLVAYAIMGWWRRKPGPVETARNRALRLLAQETAEIEKANPYQYSIRVSDILRRYVTDQYALPVTRQTSVEFLNALATNTAFTSGEQTLLKEFLDRCDLIKFARYDATTEDSRRLLEEATRFVRGEPS